MLRLDLVAEPRWLDLGHGVRLRVAPLTTALMVASRGDPAIEVLPEAASDEERALVFAKAIARQAVTDWEGVGDADGNPVPVTPGAIDALLEVWPIFEAFQLPRRDRVDLRLARKQPALGPGLAPVVPQQRQQAGRQHHLAVLAPLEALDPLVVLA